MATVKSLTAAAQRQYGGDVLAAVPAESNPVEESLSANLAAESLSFGMAGVVFGGGVLALAAVKNTVLRIKNREKRTGTRGMNDLVALLFYEDVVEIRQRKRFRNTIGELLEWHPLHEVTFFDSRGIRIAGTPWRMSMSYPKDFKGAMANLGIEIESEEE